MKHRNSLIAGMAALFMAAGVASADDAAAPAAKPAKEDTKKPASQAPQCTQAPGSHIRLAKPADCAKVARGPYRSYSKEDLERTGETDMSEALRKLDPSFR